MAFAEASTLAITEGGTAQTLFEASSSRAGFGFCNNSDTAMYLRFGGTATSAAGILVAANGGQIVLSERACPRGPISLLCATTGKTYYSWQT